MREEEAERLSTFLEQLATSYVGTDDFTEGKAGGVKVGVTDLPLLAKRSMPLCMSNMYNKLVDTHHLKHKARNQLGLFLKGIGMPASIANSPAFHNPPDSGPSCPSLPLGALGWLRSSLHRC